MSLNAVGGDHLPDDASDVATLDWDGSDLRWVTVSKTWARRVSSVELLDLTARQYRARADAVWPAVEIDMGPIPVDQLAEFAALVSELVAEQRESDGRVEVRSAHLLSQWVQGQLLSIDDPLGWVATAPRQTLAEELTDVLRRPAAPAPGPATRRYQRFLKEVARHD